MMNCKLYFRGLASTYEAEHTVRMFFPGAQVVRHWPRRGEDAVAVLQNAVRLVCGVRRAGICTVRAWRLDTAGGCAAAHAALPEAETPHAGDIQAGITSHVLAAGSSRANAAHAVWAAADAGAGADIPPSPQPFTPSEYEICRALFLLLREVTGICPPWGMLTGVRPVRLVRRLREAGNDADHVREILCGKYFVSEEKYRLAAQTAENERAALALNTPRSCSLYISIPFCPSRCSYCSFVSRTTAESGRLIAPYVARLCEELADIEALIRRLRLRLETIYIGGGTPTAISPDQLRTVMRTVDSLFDLSAVREYTVEAGRPDCTTPEKLAIIRRYGATRVSINPQTLSDEVLRAIGRRHTAQDILDCFAEARQQGFGNINMDLIAGLPHDTPEGFAASLDGVLALGPENITVHTLTLKRASNLVIDEAPAAYGDAAQMLGSCGRLGAAGYAPYYLYRQKGTLQNLENTGYTKPGFAGLYNIFIMEEVHTILSAGAGGSTKLVGADGAIRRIFNYKYPSEYIGHFDEVRAKKKGVEEFYAEHVDMDPEAPCGGKAGEPGGAHAGGAGGGM